MTRFWTVLGADYAGKSEVLQTLRRQTEWQAVSYDDPYIDGHPVVQWLREFAFLDAYNRLGQPYSAEFTFSLLTPIVLYLRDAVMRTAAHAPTVVDSYYYKLLAKSIITGIADERACAIWRSWLYPQPQGVVFLDVAPEVAWNRARGLLNAFEYHGTKPMWEGFARFQRDLRRVMLDEVKELPSVMVDANGPPPSVAADVIAALKQMGMPQACVSSLAT